MNALLLALLSVAPSLSRGPERPPNVIVILADDLGLAELGCTGSQRIQTPHLDALRQRGMLFSQAYAGSTVCAPSRCTLLTGLHTGHAQIRDNGEMPNFTGPPGAAGTTEIGGWETPPEPDGLWGGQRPLVAGTETLPRALQRQGYATFAVGKWGLGGPGSEGMPTRQGFDGFYGYLCQRNAHNYYPTYLIRDELREPLEGNERSLRGEVYAPDRMRHAALDFVRQAADRPFFLYYATPVPHLALQVPDDSLKEYVGTFEDPPYRGGKGYLPHPHPRSAYAAMVTRMDRDVGALVATLRELDLERDTLIFFTSDNGSTFELGGYDPEFFQGTGGLRGAKTWLYEGGIRVPFIACWPGRIPAGSEATMPVASWDLFPTILTLTGSTRAAPLDGVDLSPLLLEGAATIEREHLYWEFHSRGGLQALRYRNYKALRKDAHQNPRGPVELYDLERDPGETTDVAASHPEVLARVIEWMDAAHQASPVPAWNFGSR